METHNQNSVISFNDLPRHCPIIDGQTSNSLCGPTWWRLLPTIEGNTALGVSSQAKPALHFRVPLSRTRAVLSHMIDSSIQRKEMQMLILNVLWYFWTLWVRRHSIVICKGKWPRFVLSTLPYESSFYMYRDHYGYGSANEKRRYYVTPSPIGLAHTQNDPDEMIM